jgi:hypothetical protein
MRWEEKEGRIELAEGLSNRGVPEMCDYSLHSIKSRPAKVGDKLTTRDFGTGTRGFAASENPSVAVCVLPGTELAFAHEVKRLPVRLWPWHDSAIGHKTAIFRQINKDKVAAHHDALEFPDGQIVLLTLLAEDQQATILQLPAEPKTAVEAESQSRAAYVG